VKLIPASGRPSRRVLHRSPDLIGSARVSVPVATISQGVRGGLPRSAASTSTRWRKAASGPASFPDRVEETLVEEENTDEVLSELAEDAINPAAAA
jgi:hypothetical protein